MIHLYKFWTSMLIPKLWEYLGSLQRMSSFTLTKINILYLYLQRSPKSLILMACWHINTGQYMYQTLWKLGIGWDEYMPDNISQKWKHFQSQLKGINKLKFPRFIACPDTVNIQLHSFADASELIYGAVIYLRTTKSENHHSISLVCDKTKVSPIKTNNSSIIALRNPFDSQTLPLYNKFP